MKISKEIFLYWKPMQSHKDGGYFIRSSLK